MIDQSTILAAAVVGGLGYVGIRVAKSNGALAGAAAAGVGFMGLALVAGQLGRTASAQGNGSGLPSQSRLLQLTQEAEARIRSIPGLERANPGIGSLGLL